jgi:hypothetical protein
MKEDQAHTIPDSIPKDSDHEYLDDRCDSSMDSFWPQTYHPVYSPLIQCYDIQEKESSLSNVVDSPSEPEWT